MDVLWRMRHRGTDLMGSVLNVNSGDWVRRDSGVGAGIDSYYEYCLKAYILLGNYAFVYDNILPKHKDTNMCTKFTRCTGDEKYLGRFNKHYQAVMKYVSQGPMLLDVHMHRPNTNSKNFMDALLAFWPGLQVYCYIFLLTKKSSTLFLFHRCLKATSNLPWKHMRCYIRSCRDTISYRKHSRLTFRYFLLICITGE